MICEQSELEGEILIYEHSELRGEKLFQKISFFLEIHPQKKPVLKVLYIVLISFRILDPAENYGVEGCFGP